jgi:large repetitive protein
MSDNVPRLHGGLRLRTRRAVLCCGVANTLIPVMLLSSPTAALAASAVNTATVSVPSNTIEAVTTNNIATDTDTAFAALGVASDTATGINGATGNPNVLNVFGGDTINGAPATSGNATLSVAPGSTVPPQLRFDPATGVVGVNPGTPAGTYSFDYQICEALNPTNCRTATATVTVDASPIVATNDTATGINGASGATAVANAFASDTINGVAASPSNAVLSVQSGTTVPAGLTFNTATGTVDVAPGTPAGIYVINYTICEVLNPTNCRNATITVEVVAAPMIANPDRVTGINGVRGNPNVLNVFSGDTINGVPATGGNATLSVAPGSTVPPQLRFDPVTGVVGVNPGTPAGTYSFDYQICETLNPTNCRTATASVTVDPWVSGVTGMVYSDGNANGRHDSSDTPRPNWIVELVRNGVVVGTARTDAQGNYRFMTMPSGPGYEIIFRNPENGVVYGMIKNLDLGPDIVVIDQNLPIDPSGVIYDSVARTPVANSIATLLGANGAPLPTICFLSASQQAQRTGASGEYRFDIIPGAAPQCPTGELVYTIQVTPPAGYSAPSTVLVAEAGPFDPSGRTGPVRIGPNNIAPANGQLTTHYLTFRLQSGDPDVVFNHIPIDPFLTRSPLVVTKTSVKRSASVGDVVPYEITVRNTEAVQRAGVTVVDILPPGMKYVVGSASVNGTPSEPTRADRQLAWSGQIIPGNGTVRYNLSLVVGAGVTGGEKVNTGLAEGPGGASISNRGTAVVTISPSAVFDCSELLGKVFEDTNRNGYQDEGEPGVPAARVVTVNGQLITTDEFGRYHIACAAVPDARIGSNFVLKVDTRSLPLGWEATTDNPRSIRLTRGKFGELNFGVAPAEQESAGRKGAKTNPESKGE